MGERVGFGYGTASRIALYVALALGAVVAPVLLSALEPRFLANTYGKAHAKYELFGFTAASTLMLIAAVEIRRRAGRHWRELLPVVVPVLVSLPYLFLIAEYSRRTFDFGCVEYAAEAIQRGENPYGKFPPYLYPPLTGQVMAAIYPVAENAAAALGLGTDRKSVWGLVFYGYQCAQLGLIVLAYFLCLRFAQRVGVETAWAHALVAVLLLVNNPLLRTLRNAQNNLWVLDLSLLAIVLAQRMPFVSGLSLAVAVHIKLYPLVLLLPLALARCWRAVGPVTDPLDAVFARIEGAVNAISPEALRAPLEAARDAIAGLIDLSLLIDPADRAALDAAYATVVAKLKTLSPSEAIGAPLDAEYAELLEMILPILDLPARLRAALLEAGLSLSGEITAELGRVEAAFDEMLRAIPVRTGVSVSASASVSVSV